MAGYSDTPLPKKLGIKDGHRVALLDAPDGFAAILGADAVFRLSGAASFDVVVLFVKKRAVLQKKLAAVREKMGPACGFWVAWPKKASGVATDMTDHVVREIALPTGLVDNKVCAIDDTWTGLRLVIRLENR